MFSFLDYFFLQLSIRFKKRSRSLKNSQIQIKKLQKCFGTSIILIREQTTINLNIILSMGGTQCCEGLKQGQNLHSQFQYEYGQDNTQANIAHIGGIESNDLGIEVVLKECADKLRQSSKLYKDPTLKSEPLILKSSSQQDEIKCYFHRPYYFLRDQDAGRGKKYRIIDEKDCNSSQVFVKNDALQYFSVFLCFLADNSHLINDLILTQPNSYGIHAVNMYIHGVRMPIYIDDYILCYKDRPIFSQPIKGVYMWPCLLEKAWQKVKGYGSKKISITSPVQVLQHFLSYPFANYSLSATGPDNYRDIMKKKILLLNKHRSCIVTSKKEPSHKIGLSGGKHFYLKCLFEFQGKTMYYLRNPCGLFDFRGLHRMLSPQLEAKILKETNQPSITQGNFVLQQDEFLQQIQEFLIVHYNKQSNVISEQLIPLDVDSDFYLQITVEKQQQISISLIQQELEGETPFYQLSYQIISERQNKIISGLSNEEGCFGMRSTSLLQDTYQRLSAGENLIRLKKKLPRNAKIAKKAQLSDKIVITGSSEIKIDYSLQELYRNKFYDFLLRYGRREVERISSGSRFRGKDIEHGVVWLGDLVFVYIRKLNKSKSKINIQVSFPDQLNLQCINQKLKSQFTALQLIEDEMVIVLEKKDLTEETSLGKYYVETF